MPIGKSTLLNNTPDSWLSVPGRIIEIEYYSGIEVGNPSGNDKNIKNIKHQQTDDSGNIYTVFTIYHEWNDSDDLIKMTNI